MEDATCMGSHSGLHVCQCISRDEQRHVNVVQTDVSAEYYI